MGRCIAISEARRRHPRPLRVTPTGSMNHSAGMLPKPVPALPRGDTAVSKAQHWMVKFWTWMLTPGE